MHARVPKRERDWTNMLLLYSGLIVFAQEVAGEKKWRTTSQGYEKSKKQSEQSKTEESRGRIRRFISVGPRRFREISIYTIRIFAVPKAFLYTSIRGIDHKSLCTVCDEIIV